MKKALIIFTILLASISLGSCVSSKDKEKQDKAQEAFDARQKELAETSEEIKNDHEPPEITSTITEAEYTINDTIDYDRLLLSLSANDNVDGDITNKIIQTYTSVEEGTPGKYSVTYSVSDSAGNESTYQIPISIIDETHYLYEGDKCSINNVTVSIEKINDDYKVADDEFDSYKPKDGYKYISIKININNKSNKEIFVSSSHFNCYSDGKIQEEANVPEQTYYSSDLAANSKASFTLFYEVKKNSKKIEVRTTEDYWGKEPIAICLNESNDSDDSESQTAKEENKKTREDYTTDKDYDWYIRNGKEGDPFSFTMDVNQKIDDNTFLCDMNTDYTSDKAFILIDKNDYTKEIKGGEKIIEGDTIRVYGEFLDTYIYTTAIGGSKEAIRVKAVYIDIE